MQNSNLPPNVHENDPNAPWNEPMLLPCPECDRDGHAVTSCCGDDIKGNDIDLCPTCLEHCGMEPETCERCDGTGEDVLNLKINFMEQTHLGGGVYASFDGFHINLAVNHHTNHAVALDPYMVQALKDYFERVDKLKKG